MKHQISGRMMGIDDEMETCSPDQSAEQDLSKVRKEPNIAATMCQSPDCDDSDEQGHVKRKGSWRAAVFPNLKPLQISEEHTLQEERKPRLFIPLLDSPLAKFREPMLPPAALVIDKGCDAALKRKARLSISPSSIARRHYEHSRFVLKPRKTQRRSLADSSRVDYENPKESSSFLDVGAGTIPSKRMRFSSFVSLDKEARPGCGPEGQTSPPYFGDGDDNEEQDSHAHEAPRSQLGRARNESRLSQRSGPAVRQCDVPLSLPSVVFRPKIASGNTREESSQAGCKSFGGPHHSFVHSASSAFSFSGCGEVKSAKSGRMNSSCAPV